MASDDGHTRFLSDRVDAVIFNLASGMSSGGQMNV